MFKYQTGKKAELYYLIIQMGFPGGSDGKESSCNVRDPGLIPKSGRSPGEGNGNHSSILAWRIPWTEETGGLQSMGSQTVELDTTEQLNTAQA